MNGYPTRQRFHETFSMDNDNQATEKKQLNMTSSLSLSPTGMRSTS